MCPQVGRVGIQSDDFHHPYQVWGYNQDQSDIQFTRPYNLDIQFTRPYGSDIQLLQPYNSDNQYFPSFLGSESSKL